MTITMNWTSGSGMHTPVKPTLCVYNTSVHWKMQWGSQVKKNRHDRLNRHWESEASMQRSVDQAQKPTVLVQPTLVTVHWHGVAIVHRACWATRRKVFSTGWTNGVSVIASVQWYQQYNGYFWHVSADPMAIFIWVGWPVELTPLQTEHRFNRQLCVSTSHWSNNSIELVAYIFA